MGQQSPARTKFKQLALANVCLTACLIATAGLVACQAAPAKSHQQSIGAAAVSICKIDSHKNNFIGKTVKITALWKTDNLHYSYFEDVKSGSEKCQGGNVIQLGYIHKMHDQSVLNFFGSGKELCKEKKQSIVCVQSAHVTFIATIMSDKDGLYVHLNKVLDYKYEE